MCWRLSLLRLLLSLLLFRGLGCLFAIGFRFLR